jgi:integrase
MHRDQLRELDADPPIWDKKPKETKNKSRHRVPLNPDAVALIREALATPPQYYSTISGRAMRRATEAPPVRHRPCPPGPLKAVCENCGEPFTSTRPSQYCSRSCYHVAWRRERHKVVVGIPSPYVFQSAVTGKHVTYLDRTWQKLLKMTGIEDFHIHDLRHSAATLMVSHGIPLHTVGKVLGHRRARSTERYAHVMVDAQQAAVEKLGDVVGLDKIVKKQRRR